MKSLFIEITPPILLHTPEKKDLFNHPIRYFCSNSSSLFLMHLPTPIPPSTSRPLNLHSPCTDPPWPLQYLVASHLVTHCYFSMIAQELERLRDQQCSLADAVTSLHKQIGDVLSRPPPLVSALKDIFHVYRLIFCTVFVCAAQQ